MWFVMSFLIALNEQSDDHMVKTITALWKRLRLFMLPSFNAPSAHGIYIRDGITGIWCQVLDKEANTHICTLRSGWPPTPRV